MNNKELVSICIGKNHCYRNMDLIFNIYFCNIPKVNRNFDVTCEFKGDYWNPSDFETFICEAGDRE